MANTTIQLKYSVVTSNAPSALANGELAINGADGKLFYRTPSGTIQSIVTYPGPAGLNKEIQFNDAGVAGSNSALTFDKSSASLNVTNINVTTRITTGSGAGGSINGANTIYANNFTANSTTSSTSNSTGAIVSNGGIGVKGNVYASNTYVLNDVVAGLQDGPVLGGATNPIIAAIGNTDQYIQTYTINYANTANASADLVAYPNNGSDANGWIDLGITSNAFSASAYSVTGRNEGYLFMSAPGGSGTSGNLVIATDSTGTYNTIEFVVGGFGKGKTNSNVKITTGTSSTSNTTGALQVVGGLGVKGNVNADTIYSNGSQLASLGDAMAMAIALG